MRGTTYKRGKTWSVVYDEQPDETGKRKQRSKGGFATRKDAERFLTDTLARIDTGSYAQPSKLALGDYLEREWLPAVEGTLRPLSVTKYRATIRLYIAPRIGSQRLQGVSGGHLNALYGELEQAGLSVSTRRLVHAVLHRAFRDAVRWGKLIRNPADMADPPSRGRSRAHAWTASELRRFLDHVADDRLVALWRLGGTTGMRRGELAGLTWRALDLDGARLAVEQQLVPTRGGPTLGPPKSARSRRTVALDPVTVDMLRAHVRRRSSSATSPGPRTSIVTSCSPTLAARSTLSASPAGSQSTGRPRASSRARCTRSVTPRPRSRSRQGCPCTSWRQGSATTRSRS